MSDEFQTVANLIESLASIFILIVGLYRVGLMSKSFVDPLFKSKARWSAALLGAILVTNVSSLFPTSSNALIGTLEFVPFPVLLIVVYAFVDRTIVVAGKMDFFHRDVLSWSRVRVPLFVVVLVTSLSFGVASFYPTEASAPYWIVDLVDVCAVLLLSVLGYASVVLAISARRSADKTLRRHIWLLGISLAMFVTTLGLSILPNGDLDVFLNAVISVASLVVLYFAVMSLTPLGKVSKADSQA